MIDSGISRHTFMQHKAGRYKDYFAWHCKPDGTRLSQGPAPDGEEFFAMALFFASNRWGDGAEPYDYDAQARKYFVPVYIKANMARVIRCGTRKQN